MEEKDIEIGRVCRQKGQANPVRIIHKDEAAVYYMVKSVLDGWGFPKGSQWPIMFGRRAIQSVSSDWIATKENMPIRNEEIQSYRLDLPFVLLRLRGENILNLDPEIAKAVINAPRIYFLVEGFFGGGMQPTLVEAGGENNLTLGKVLEAGISLKKEKGKRTSEIGIFRIGMFKGIPLFSVGDFVDSLGIYQKEGKSLEAKVESELKSKEQELEINAGGVFRGNWDGKLARVIRTDEIETFFDVPGLDGAWPTYEKQKKNIIFYRLPTLFFCQNAHPDSFAPLTKNDEAILRMDLPNRLLRFKGLEIRSEEDIADFVKDALVDEAEISAKAILLEPHTLRGAPKKMEIYESLDGDKISGRELLTFCMTLKLQIYGPFQEIGVFRSGIKSLLPTYYIGDYHDRANHTTRFEEGLG